MSLNPWSAVLLASAVFVPGSVSQVEPSEAARSAIATLSAPSVPQPLPGSVPLDEDVFRLDGDCARAIEMYLAPDAPVPNGATVRQRGQSVVVELPYATSGVFFEGGSGYCQYRIVNAPTIRVDSTLTDVPAGDGYGPVLCSEKSESVELIVITELVGDGGPAVLVIKEQGAAVVRGSLADVFASGQEPALPLGVSAISPGPQQFDFEITGSGGSARVRGDCTGSVFQYLGRG